MANDGFIEFLSPNALRDLQQAETIVNSLVKDIEKINNIKAPTSPSGVKDAGKNMADSYEKTRLELEKLSAAQKDAESKRKASINAQWEAFEKAKRKEKEASDKLLATEIANAEKAAKAEIDKNNKILQAAEKRAEKEKQIEERKAASILASQQKQIERQAAIDAKNATSGSSSKLEMISSLNKQRYLEEQKLANDAEKAMSHKYQEELKLARQKQELIASLGKQQQKEINDAEKEAKSAERSALANQRLSDAYGKLNAQRNQAARTLQNLIASETASNAEIRKAQREFDVLNAKVKKADQAVGNFSKNVGNYGSALNGATQLMGAFGIATGIYLAADLVKNIFQTTKELQSLDLALKMVSETQDKYAANTSFVRELSEKWGIEIKGLTEQFTQFYVNAKGKLSDDAIRTSFEGIAKAGSLMGISIDKQNDAFYAFNQMLSKGTVQAEELKKQLGNALPGAIKAATMAYQELNPSLKVTEQMMLDQMKAGKLISNEMVPAIIRAYQKLYGIETVNSVDTLAAAQNRLSNSWTAMVKAMNEGSTSGVSKFFNVILTGLTNILTLTSMLFKDEKQLQEYFQSLGASKAGEELDAYREKFKTFSEETRTFMDSEYAEKQRQNIKMQLQVIKEQQALRKTILGGDRAAFHLQTKIEEDALVSLGKSRAILNLLKNDAAAIEKPKPSTQSATKEELADAKRALKEKADFEEELRKNDYQRKLSDLEREKEIIKDLKDLETTSLEDKLFLEDAFAFKQIQINQAVYDEKIRLAQKEYDEKYKLVKGNASQEEKVLKFKNNQEAIALNDLLTANEDALAASLAKQTKLKEDALKTDTEKTKEWYEKNPPMFLQSDREAAEAKKIKAILEDLQNEFRNYIQGFQQTFFNQAGFGQSFDFFIKLDEAGKTAFDRINDSNLTSAEKFKANFLAISESAQEMYNFINQMSQQNFDAEKERLEQEVQIALAFAGDSETAKAEIERQAEAKRKEIRIREFKAKKQQAVVNIVIDTAQAIMATYGQAGFFGGLAGAAILAAIGAAQIAMVQSQEMPAFKDGGVHDGGLMLVNDAKGSNFRETIKTPDGKIYQPKERNVIMNAPKGTEIFTPDQWQKNLDSMLMSNNISYAQPNINVNGGAMTDAQVNKIVSTIQNKQEYHQTFDRSGIKNYISNGHTQKEILNNQVTFGR
jgi:tape measure domain-containing protein